MNIKKLAIDNPLNYLWKVNRVQHDWWMCSTPKSVQTPTGLSWICGQTISRIELDPIAKLRYTRRTIDSWMLSCDTLKNAQLMAAGSKADAYLAVRNEEDLIATVVDTRKTWLVRLDRFRTLVGVPGVRQATVVAHFLADCPLAIHLRISHELKRWTSYYAQPILKLAGLSANSN